MKKFYIIAPVVLLGLFIAYFMNFSKEQKVKETKKQEELAAIKAAEDKKKKETEDRAKADADERTKKRQEEEAKKEADKRKKWDDQGKEIADATAKYLADGKKYTAEVASLEKQLADLRAKKDAASREAFDLQKKVELALIAKRNAELEIQRMTEMVTRKASDSALAKPPAPVVAKTP